MMGGAKEAKESASAENPFGNMLPLMLMGDNKDFKDVLPLMFMMNGASAEGAPANQNMLMMAMLMGDSAKEDLLPLMFMGNMFK
jgi:hypothetical protein